MSGAVKICALERLAAAIEREVPRLRGRTCAGPATRAHRRVLPSLAAVTEGRFRFEPQQEQLEDPRTGALREPTPGAMIAQVGEWIGVVKLELAATSPDERGELEELVERAFLSGAGSTVDPLYPDPGREMRSGVILIDAPECYGARMSFLLDEDEWQDELGSGDEWVSAIRLTAELPALVPRYGRARMTDLRLYLTESLETVATGAPPPAGTEKYQINVDGTATPIP